MDFFDRLWVPQTSPPEPIYIILLICIDILILIFYLVTYKMINYRIKRSMRGIAKDAKVEIPNNLMRSLNSIFLGAVIMGLLKILTRASYFFNVDCPESASGIFVDNCYLLTGEGDFISFIAIQLVSIGLYNFYLELSRKLGDENAAYRPFWLALILILIVFFSDFLLPKGSITIELFRIVLIIISFLGLFFYLTLNMLYKFKKETYNPLIKIRKYIIFAAFILLNLGQILWTIPFLPQKNGRYPVQESGVELYLSVQSLLLTIPVIFILITIFLPSFVVKLLAKNKKNLMKYWDIRFDIPLELTGIIENDTSVAPVNEKKYVLAYEKHEYLICKQLNPIFKGDIISFRQRTEETLIKILLPNVDIMYFSAFDNRSVRSQYNRINREFGQKFSYKNGKIKYQNIHIFDDPNTIYALIIIYPSIYNSHQNMWLINFTPELTGNLVNFFKTYSEYLKGLVNNEAPLTKIIAFALRFINQDETIKDIPSLEHNSKIPDTEYIYFFGFNDGNRYFKI